jgi:hypothetical protein
VTSTQIMLSNDGTTGKEIIGQGDTATPTLSVQPPAGAAITDNGQPVQYTRSGGEVVKEVLHSQHAGAPFTIVAIRNAPAGMYKVTSVDGTCLRNVEYGDVLAPAAATGTAAPLPAVDPRTGQHLERIRVTLADVPGQTVKYFDVAPNGARTLIGSAASARVSIASGGHSMRPITGHTTLTFAPIPSAPGRHTVIAQISQDGFPRAVRTLTSYRVAKVILATPRVATRIVRGTLAVRWHPVPYATQYLVEIKLSDGRDVVQRVGATHRLVAVKQFAPGDRATVTVTPTSAQGYLGKSGVARAAAKPLRVPLLVVRVAGGQINPPKHPHL